VVKTLEGDAEAPELGDDFFLSFHFLRHRISPFCERLNDFIFSSGAEKIFKTKRLKCISRCALCP
jgi:hypothetical protein